MVPEPYFDEEMGVTDTIWNAKNKNTNEPIAKNDALKVYSIATLNLTEAAPAESPLLLKAYRHWHL